MGRIACFRKASLHEGKENEHPGPVQEQEGAYCPHKRRGARWVLFAAGAGSLLWFLIRVIPKPSRAAYPCQRAAAPFASSFVLWLLAVLSTRWALGRQREFSRQARFGAAFVCSAVCLAGAVVAIRNVPENRVWAGPSPHAAIGSGKGIHPGRVVWVHAPDATDWAGWNSLQRWWASNCTDLAVVEQMMARGVRDLAGEATDAAAWAALFTDFNSSHGRGSRGYEPAEKLAIKINMTTCNGGTDCNIATHEKTKNLNRIDNSPQMLLALLQQLVYVAGVPQTNISIGDPTALMPGFIYTPLHTEFPGVTYFEVMGGLGRQEVKWSATRCYWSTSESDGKLQDYVPVPFAGADYLINFAILKGHSSGITGCGKNLYGALKRCPDGGLYGEGKLDYYNLHLSLPNAEWSPGMGRYRAVVDLMGNQDLGDKTLLCLIDGLFGGYYWDSRPYPWKMPPFGNGVIGDWPSSLFLSQDPVAIDSVAYDFLLTEWPNVVNNGVGTAGSLEGGAEDYLHEAALAAAPPSGTFYDPELDGIRMSSLGVHEHWTDAVTKQYSRNRGQTNGIELVYARLSKTPPTIALRHTGAEMVISWPAAETGFRLQSATSLTPAANWRDVPGTPAMRHAQYVVTNSIDAGTRFYRLTR